ncbi:MAG: hypothetical protein ABEJ76_04850 [Halanaeroarchaeum sp.]
MAEARDQELVDRFETFYRRYYQEEIGDLASKYPRERKSLVIDWTDLYRWEPDFADEFVRYPDRFRSAAEEALHQYDLPVDVSLSDAHVRIANLGEVTEIRDIRSDHLNTLVSVRGIVRKATNVRPKIREAAFVCQRCGAETYVPQTDAGFQDPYQCESCERQGPFKLDPEQSTFVDAQKLRIQESPEGLGGGETPQSVDMNVEDDLTGEVSPGDHVVATGVLRLDQGKEANDSPVFDVYLEGVSLEIEDEEFEEMDISEEDKRDIVELSDREDIYEQIVDSIAPAIYGYDETKLAMALQLFSGVTKHLPDGTRIRGDLHMLLIGDPGTGKCVAGDTDVTLADGTRRPIRDVVNEHLQDPTPVDDGVYDEVAIPLPSMRPDGTVEEAMATRVWKREAPDHLYRISLADGTDLEVTPSHPLFVRDGSGPRATKAEELTAGMSVATADISPSPIVADGGVGDVATSSGTNPTAPRVGYTQISAIRPVEPDEDWVYDLEVAGTHNYLTEQVVSHNSQLLQYIRHIAPRSVYTSGKGSSSAGLTAAAVRDDFGDGQQWTLEAGALVLADKGIAAVDELDKMRCVTGDTLVSLGDGRVDSIGEIARRTARDGTIESHESGRSIRDFGDLTVQTMTDDGSIAERSVTAVHEYDAPDDLCHVTLESGETLTSTTDHPYFVFEDGERVEHPAEDLESGDLLYVPAETRETAPDGGSIAAHDSSGRSTPADDTTVVPIASVGVIESGSEGYERVYDLTVEGTQNFVANGMVVHNSEDRSAMHEALEQQSISISKAGINATLKSRCSLLGAANPKYGRFDQYEPIGEQIDLEPALISRFDLIFTVTDQPDEERDAELAQHIIRTNYAGELNTHRENVTTSNVSEDQIQGATDEVAPAIDADFLRKYVAYARRNAFPTMTADAREAIEQFYVDLRSKGQDEDAPVPITARKLEALVRLAEASARVRLSDTVEEEDAQRVIDIVRRSLQAVGVDPETDQFDADVIETGTSKSQRDRIKNIKGLIEEIEDDFEEGAPVEEVLARAEEVGMERSKAEHEIEKLKQRGEVYEPSTEHLRTT